MPDSSSTSGRGDSRLVLVLLGTPRLDRFTEQGGPKTSVSPGKSLALFTYLALAPHRSASRERLCDLLWGDKSAEDARTQLRQTLYLLKQQVGADVFEARAHDIALVADAEVDSRLFTAEIAAGRLEPAERLYAGDFFSGFAPPGPRRA